MKKKKKLPFENVKQIMQMVCREKWQKFGKTHEALDNPCGHLWTQGHCFDNHDLQKLDFLHAASDISSVTLLSSLTQFWTRALFEHFLLFSFYAVEFREVALPWTLSNVIYSWKDPPDKTTLNLSSKPLLSLLSKFTVRNCSVVRNTGLSESRSSSSRL